MKPISAPSDGALKKALSSSGRMFIRITAAAVPNRMKGMRLPIFVVCRSDSDPNSGRRNSARMLSAAMIAPEYVSFR